MAFRGVLFLPRGFASSAAYRKELDLVASVYIKQIREMGGKKDLLESSPEVKKQLEEQLNRLAQKFHLPSADVATKLNLQFEKATVQSSVDEVTEGKPIDELAKELADSRVKYEAEQREKKRQEQEKLAAVRDSEESDYSKDFFPVPPPHIEAQQLAASKSS